MFYYLTKYYCDGDAENDTNNMKQKKMERLSTYN